MTITNGYATLDQVKYRLNPAGLATSANDDGVMELIIEATSRFIDEDTRRRFWVSATDEKRYYTASDGGTVFCDDIVSITTLKTDDNADRTYETTWATTDYDLMPLNAETYSYIVTAPNGRYSFPLHRKGVEIEGKFGMTCPKSITEACVEIVVSLYQSRRGQGTEGAATITAAGVVITPKDVPQMAERILARWRRLA